MSKHSKKNEELGQPNVGFNTSNLNASQIMCMTNFTKTGERNMINRKPYRTQEQRRLARKHAYKAKDGAYRSQVQVSYHTH